MRRLLIAVVVLAAGTLFPSAALADAPTRVYFSSGGGLNLALSPAGACLGSEGSFFFEFDSLPGDRETKLFAQTSRRTQQAHVFGTFQLEARTTAGSNDDPSIYDGTIELRVNDMVTPIPGSDPPEGVVPHTVMFDMIPVAGGPSVPMIAVIQTIVVWLPDGTISVIPRLDSLSCA